MVEILNRMVEELMKEDLTVDELKNLAKEVSNHGALVETLQSHPNIDFECIEMSGVGSDTSFD